MLEGVRVIDLTEGTAGPLATAQLGTLGAEIVKVERGAGDRVRDWNPKINGESAIFMQLNHDKKSIAIDYEMPEGLCILRDLVKTADVVVEDFKPGKAQILGLGYDDLRLFKRDLIYCSIYPFGDMGPYQHREATELELQGMSGLVRFCSEMGKEPIRAGADVISTNSGMFAFAGIMAAIYNRGRTHKGERIVVSMLAVAMYLATHWVVAQSGADNYGGFWLTGPHDHAETGFKTANKPITFGMVTKGEQQARAAFAEFCKGVGLGDLLQDPYFVEKGFRTLGMGRDAQEMKPLYEAAFENWDAYELANFINRCGGLAAVFLSYSDLFDPLHEQIKVNKMVVEQEHPRAGKIGVVSNPWKHSDGAAEVKLPSPALGEHTEEILKSLNYAEPRVKRLRELGVINGPIQTRNVA